MRKRIDRLLVEGGFASSRERAKALVLSGSVIVNDQRVDKPGSLFRAEDEIRIRGRAFPYVSRGGVKLESALEVFRIKTKEKIALDVGASTGGFTDCLLQNGVRKVYALDVGYGQLAWSLRQDPRVFSLERTNIRHVAPRDFPGPFDLITIDVSFISLTLVLPVVRELIQREGEIVALIKPQFEVGKGKVGKKGVVRDPALHEEVVEKIRRFAKKIGLLPLEVAESPLLGPEGNKEFLIHLKKNEEKV